VFDIQEKVSRSIVEALEIKLTSEESVRLSERPIENVAAYECFLKAKHDIWSFTKEGAERAVQYLHNALDILGENAAIYAGLGLAYFQLVNIGVRQDETSISTRPGTTSGRPSPWTPGPPRPMPPRVIFVC